MNYKVKFCLGCLVAGAVIVAGAGNVQAQGGRGQGGQGGGFGRMFGGGAGGSMFLLTNENVQKELDLVDDQVEELKALQEEVQNEMRDMFSGMRDMDPSERESAMEDLRSKMESKMTDFQKRVDEVLLPHQQKRLKQLTVQSQSRGRGIGSGLLSDTVKKELDITSEQEEKMREAAEKAQEEYQAELRKLQSKFEDRVLNQLTDDQRKKYKELVGDAFDFGQMRFGGGPQPGGGGNNQRGNRPRSDF